jgi:hypothetical protein
VSQIILIPSTGKRFYAHRIALLASSDAFRAMFDGGYRVSFDLPQHNVLLLVIVYRCNLFLF